MPLRFFLHLLFITFLMLAGSGVEAQAREQITDYHVTISVNADRTVDITESIEVFVEGMQIKRGLLRDIPRDLQAQGRALCEYQPSSQRCTSRWAE